MPSDFENGAKKTIDLSVQTEKITSDILKNAMAEFLDGNAEKKGRMTFVSCKRNAIPNWKALKSPKTILLIFCKQQENMTWTLL